MCLKATCQIIIWLGIFYKSQYTYKHAVARWKWKAKVEDWSLVSIHLCSLGTQIKLVEYVGELVRAVHLWLAGEHERLLLMTHLGLHLWWALLDEGLVHNGVYESLRFDFLQICYFSILPAGVVTSCPELRSLWQTRHLSTWPQNSCCDD